MAGGKRKGAGRPVGSTIDNPKVQIAARIDADLAAWLKSHKKYSRIVAAALAAYRERLERLDNIR